MPQVRRSRTFYFNFQIIEEGKSLEACEDWHMIIIVLFCIFVFSLSSFKFLSDPDLVRLLRTRKCQRQENASINGVIGKDWQIIIIGLFCIFACSRVGHQESPKLRGSTLLILPFSTYLRRPFRLLRMGRRRRQAKADQGEKMVIRSRQSLEDRPC